MSFKYLSSFPLYSMYMVYGIVFTIVFARLYTWVTPHDEFKLIRKGNWSATISFIGTMFGATLPMVELFRQLINPIEIGIWCGIALAVQLMTYFACMWFLGRAPVSEEDSSQSRCDAFFTAGTSIVVGLISAAMLH